MDGRSRHSAECEMAEELYACGLQCLSVCVYVCVCACVCVCVCSSSAGYEGVSELEGR